HPNDHVNMGQSSNDTFPTAVHLAALDAATNDLLPSLDALAGSLAAKSEELRDAVKPGRTHLMDAVPVTLGQEFAGYSAQVREGAARVEATFVRVRKLPLGGTAVGTGLNAHPEVAARGRPKPPPPGPGPGARGGSPPPPAWSCPRRPTRSRPRGPATPWSSCPGRSRRWPGAAPRSPTTSSGWGRAPGPGWASWSCPSSRRAPRSCRARST